MSSQQISTDTSSICSDNDMKPVFSTPLLEKATPEYLQELLKDKKQLQTHPNIFKHLDIILEKEIQRVRERLFHMNGSVRKAEDSLPEPSGPIVSRQEKVFVPIKENPNYNFVGRLLGPRGLTAKQLEQDLECKIMVRGQGSMRDKRKEDMNRGKPNWEHLDEELHILVSVEDYENRADLKLKRAVDTIRQFLEQGVRTDGTDEVKRRQLLELAILNGTYRDTNKVKALQPHNPTMNPPLPLEASPPGSFLLNSSSAFLFSPSNYCNLKNRCSDGLDGSSKYLRGTVGCEDECCTLNDLNNNSNHNCDYKDRQQATLQQQAQLQQQILLHHHQQQLAQNFAVALNPSPQTAASQLLPASVQQQQLALLAASGRLQNQSASLSNPTLTSSTSPGSQLLAACLPGLTSAGTYTAGSTGADPSLQAAAALLCGNSSAAGLANPLLLNSATASVPSAGSAELAQMAAMVSVGQMLPSAQNYSSFVQSPNQNNALVTANQIASNDLHSEHSSNSLKMRNTPLAQAQRMHPYLR